MFKAIIVDDEYDIRQGLKKLIDWEAQGFVIVGEAEDGLQALEVFHREKPSLVITDIKMPAMDGIELIKEIKSIQPSAKVLVLSGYNDFSYAREAMRYGVNNYLLKPVDSEELCKELAGVRNCIASELSLKRDEKKMLEEIENSLLQKLVRGEAFTPELREMASRCGIDLSGRQLGVLLVEMDRYDQFLMNLTDSDIQLKRFAIKNIIGEILNEKKNGYLFQNAANQFGVLLVGAREELDRHVMLRTAENIVRCVERFANEPVTVGVGRVAGGVEEIMTSYLQAQGAVERSFFSRQQKVLLYEETAVDIWSLKWNASGLRQAVCDLKRDRIEAEIAALFTELDRNSASRSTAVDIFKIVTVELSAVLVEYNSNWKQLFAGKFSSMEDVLRKGGKSDLKGALLDICNEICSFIEACKRSEKDGNFNELLHYIDGHYEEEINLKKLSDLFYMNASYLGQLFKKETGQYFNDYINSIRVQKAKALLEAGKLTISEIGEKVGYKYPDHFYKAFRHITGLNPGDYRKKASGNS